MLPALDFYHLKMFKSVILGVWPGKKKKLFKASEPWSKAKQDKEGRKERKIKRKRAKETRIAEGLGPKKKKRKGTN